MEKFDSNPYEAPERPADESTPPSILIWAVVAVFLSSIVGGVIGAMIGGALGVFLPDYYRSVFAGGGATGFNPVAVGIGLGLTQGVMFGGVVGLAIVAIYFHHRRKIAG